VEIENVIIYNITMINLYEFYNFERMTELIQIDRAIFDTDDKNIEATAEKAVINLNKFIDLIKTSISGEKNVYSLLKSKKGTTFDLKDRSLNFSNIPGKTYGVNWYNFVTTIQKNYVKGVPYIEAVVNLISLSITETGGVLSIPNNNRLYNILSFINLMVSDNISFKNVIAVSINNFVNTSLIKGITVLQKGNGDNIITTNILPKNDEIVKSKWNLLEPNQIISMEKNSTLNMFIEFDKLFDINGDKIT
jgi:hypothetical protein